LRVLYATSEEFTNDFIRSLTTKSVHEFGKRYRSVDLLLIDDIQFFTGKESTQEQFFHTFNALHQSGKQLVLTADRPPKDILGLEERLLSRFSWGLVADIQPPSLETRIAILQKKADSDGVTVPTDVLSYIADSITSNVRELEGALVRLVAYSSLRRKELTISLAQDVLKDAIRSKSRPVTIEKIQKEVAAHFKLSEELLKSKKKNQEIVIARQVAMYLCRTLTNSSLKLIGINFGNRDHSTVIHSCHQVQDMMKSSIDFKLQIDQLINVICSQQ
jgi:chromosomal replication initiator protein